MRRLQQFSFRVSIFGPPHRAAAIAPPRQLTGAPISFLVPFLPSPLFVFGLNRVHCRFGLTRVATNSKTYFATLQPGAAMPALEQAGARAPAVWRPSALIGFNVGFTGPKGDSKVDVGADKLIHKGRSLDNYKRLFVEPEKNRHKYPFVAIDESGVLFSRG